MDLQARTVAPCPTCGEELTYIAQYDQYYCDSCGNQAPKGYRPPSAGARTVESPATESHEGHYHCPRCSGELEYIEKYSRYYCWECRKYAPKGISPVPAPRWVPVEQKVDPEPATRAAESVETQTAPEATPEPNPEGERGPEEEAPRLRRSAVRRARKADLIESCRAHGLETTGTNKVLRDRLLRHAEDHGLFADEALMVEAEPEPEPAPTPSAPAPEREEAEAEPPLAEPRTSADELEAALEDVVTQEAEVTDAAPEVEGEERVAEKPPTVEPEPETTVRAVAPAPPLVREPAPAMPAPTPAAPVEAPAPPPAPFVEAPKALSCQTCGGDLTYIAQYGRHYCYLCTTYAPRGYGEERAARVVAARPAVEARPSVPPVQPPASVAAPCPTCGQRLTFIPQYGRSYCYGCGQYAPRAYAGPTPAAVFVTSAPVATRTPVAFTAAQPEVAPAARAVRSGHRHGRPGTGMGLAALGFALFIVHNLLTGLLPALGLFDPASLGAELSQLLLVAAFLGLVLAAVGVVVGLRSLGSR